MAQKLAERIKAETGRPARIEGLPNADWVLIDAGDVIVHLFRPEVRTFYNLERMWSFGEAPAGNGPLLLIGAGSGLAGLRAHIIQAVAQGRKVWLIYGERHPERDGALAEQMKIWREDGRERHQDVLDTVKRPLEHQHRDRDGHHGH